MREFQAESGLDTGRVQYTVRDGKGGVFQNVRRLLEFSPSRIVLAGRKGTVVVEGKSLSLGKCFLGDIEISGDIHRVERQDAGN